MAIDTKLTQIEEQIKAQKEYLHLAKKGVQFRIDEPVTNVWADSIISAVNIFKEEYQKMELLKAQKKILLEIKESEKT